MPMPDNEVLQEMLEYPVQIPEEVITSPKSYWGVLWALLPVAICGGIAGGIRFIKTAHGEKTHKDKLWSLFFSVFYSGFIALVGIMIMPLVVSVPLNERMELGLACILGGLGTKSIDILLRKVFGLSITELQGDDEKSHSNPKSEGE